VTADSVYFGSTDGRVYALDRTDGTQRWSYRANDDVIASPTVVDGSVYAVDTLGWLHALESPG